MTPDKTSEAGASPGESGLDEPTLSNSTSAQRIDRWLWCARFFKTRGLAAKFVSEGHIRITRANNATQDTVRAEKPSVLVRAGDTLVFTRHDRLRIIDVRACAARRGPATEAATLYEDRSPPPPPKEEKQRGPFAREPGAGRPTKRERRALDAMKAGS